MKKYIVGLLAFLPMVSLAAGGLNILGVIALVQTILTTVMPVVATLAVLFFLWSLAMYMTKAGEEKQEARQQMMWGIIILFVMVSMWGFVAILDQTLFGDYGM